jgi:hypothetical protein
LFLLFLSPSLSLASSSYFLFFSHSIVLSKATTSASWQRSSKKERVKINNICMRVREILFFLFSFENLMHLLFFFLFFFSSICLLRQATYTQITSFDLSLSFGFLDEKERKKKR